MPPRTRQPHALVTHSAGRTPDHSRAACSEVTNPHFRRRTVVFEGVAHPDGLPYSATVSSARHLTAHMRRVTFEGPGLAAFTSSGRPDERLLVGLPPDGSDRRSYTVRRWDPQRGELTVDFVVHAGGNAARWAEQATPGETVTLSAASGWYTPPADSEWQLLLSDMTALPAVGRILEELPAGSRAHVIAEIIEPADEQRFVSSADVTVTWLHGHGNGLTPSMLHAAATGWSRPTGPGYVWFAGEARTSREVRRWLRHELGWSPERYDVMGYWRAHQEEWTRRYEQVQTEIEAVADRALAAGDDLDTVRDAVDAAMERAGL
ncbi:MAG: siderophore-interacting protein [Rhodococcus sp.]|nr:siderophore-interacting protein [Rhodococcus sp. (in: high G+C Gram-positive bacteria)]